MKGKPADGKPPKRDVQGKTKGRVKKKSQQPTYRCPGGRADEHQRSDVAKQKI
jgi:hypothetical protein